MAFVPSEFRVNFPQFASEDSYSDKQLILVNKMAVKSMTLSDEDDFLYDLLTAHIALLVMTPGTTGAGGFQSASTVGDISVTYAPPPYKSGWQSYLSKTTYGEQLWMLLSAMSAGGEYVGGLPELHPFTRTGGYHC